MILEKILRGIVIAGAFVLPFIPLIVAHSLFFPFITGKNFTFRILVEIMTASWLALMILSPQYRPWRWFTFKSPGAWILTAAAVFVVVIGLADAFGANPFKSFWSNYERMEGWVTHVHLFLLLVVSVSTLTTEKLWRWWWHTSIGVSVLVGIFGLSQLAGFTTINQGANRLDATFGNATYLGIYMLFHLFMTALMWSKYAVGNRQLVFVYGGIMFLQAVILFFTETRGAILGVVGGALLAALIIAVFESRTERVWRYAVAALIGVAILVGAFFALKETPVVQNVNALSRIASISFSETTTASRFYNWGMAWQGFQERPLLGWGQENYNLVFNKYYDHRMFNQEPWFDRVHQIFFDWLIAGGILGLLSYLMLFGTVVYAAWRSQSVVERGILIGLLAGYLFYLLFTFDNIMSYIMFFMVAGYLAFRTRPEETAVAERPQYPEAVQYAVVLAAVVIGAGSIWLVNGAAIAANKDLIQAVSPQGTPSINLEYFEKAANSGTMARQEAREHLIQGAIQLSSNQNIPNEDKQRFFEVAEREMLKQMETSPLDARFPLFLGVLYDTYGQHDKAKETLELAQSLSPDKQQIAMQRGMNALNRGKPDEAVAIFKEVHERTPEYPQGRIYYAALLIETGNIEEAEKVLAPIADANGIVTDSRILNAYVAADRLDKAAAIWEVRIAENPDDPQARFTLAAVYYQMGEKQKAIDLLEQTAIDIPASKSQVDTVIQQIRDGTVQILR